LENPDMTVAMGTEPMAKKKKSEIRRHTAMARIDGEALEQARLAASLMRMSLADYITELIKKNAPKDISREAKKLTGGGDQ